VSLQDIQRISGHGALVNIAIFVACLILVLLVSDDASLRQYLDLYVILFETVAWMLLKLVRLICLPLLAQFILVLVAVGLNFIRFGGMEDLMPTFFLQINAEPTPLGFWDVELFSAKGFAHSEIHEDPSVANRAAMWLLAKRHCTFSCSYGRCIGRVASPTECRGPYSTNSAV